MNAELLREAAADMRASRALTGWKGVALAVADLLDQAADTMHACGGPADCKDYSRALAVARAYLGRDA